MALDFRIFKQLKIPLVWIFPQVKLSQLKMADHSKTRCDGTCGAPPKFVHGCSNCGTCHKRDFVNYCEMCKKCLSSPHLLCTSCGTCADGHQHCTGCNTRTLNGRNLCDACIPRICDSLPPRCDKCYTCHSEDLSFCSNCKTCTSEEHTKCGSCGKCETPYHFRCGMCKECFVGPHRCRVGKWKR